MITSRLGLPAVLVVIAYVLQVSVFDQLPLPGGHPDVLLVIVVAVALATGPFGGAVTGFAAGLLSDLAPPADHTLGKMALALTVVGYVSGLLEDVDERSAFAPLVMVALATAVAAFGYAAIGAILGDPRVDWPSVVRTFPSTALYDVLLTPFVVPFVARLVRRLDPDPSHR